MRYNLGKVRDTAMLELWRIIKVYLRSTDNDIMSYHPTVNTLFIVHEKQYNIYHYGEVKALRNTKSFVLPMDEGLG